MLFVYSNLFFSGLNYYLDGRREVLHRVLRFPLRKHIRVGALVVVSLPKCDPKPLLKWIDLNHFMLLHILVGATMHFGKCV